NTRRLRARNGRRSHWRGKPCNVASRRRSGEETQTKVSFDFFRSLSSLRISAAALEQFRSRCVRFARVVRAFSRGPQFAPLLRELGWEARVLGQEEKSLKPLRSKTSAA